MSKSKSLNEDILKLIDLIERKCELYADNKTQGTSSEIRIYPEDLEKFGLNYETFSEVLYQLNKEMPEWDFPKVQQLDDYAESNLSSDDPPEPIVYITLPEHPSELIGKSREELHLFTDRDGTKEEWVKESAKDIFTATDIKVIKKSKSTPTLKIKGEFLIFDTQRVPMERGQKKMTELFLEHAETFYGDRCTKKGRNLSVEELQTVGFYSTEGSFRNALKNIRSKLSSGKLPVSIENITTKKYQMVIKYKKI